MSNLSDIRVIPTNEDNTVCAICKDQQGKLHTCKQCKPGAWVICDDCKNNLALKSPRCPICRSVNEIPKIKKLNRRLLSISKYVYVIKNILFMCISLFTIVYLGKLFLFFACINNDCVKNDKSCDCNKYSNRVDFWYNFKYMGGEFICGMIFAVPIFIIYVFLKRTIWRSQQ